MCVCVCVCRRARRERIRDKIRIENCRKKKVYRKRKTRFEVKEHILKKKEKKK